MVGVLELPRLGGGPNDAGSLSDDNGRETCSVWTSADESLPLPIQVALFRRN